MLLDAGGDRAAPPAPPSLAAVTDAAFWRALNPALHVDDAGYIEAAASFDVDDSARTLFSERMIREGYFDYFVPPSQWSLSLSAVADGLRRMEPAGLIPAFAFAYDDVWLMFAVQERVIAHFLGDDYRMLPDFWAWRVDPTRADGGWRPHRDKGRVSIFPDRRPKSLTVWIPLSDATPTNGCMYIVPADRDPTYDTVLEHDWDFAHADIRALPAVVGNVIVWNQAVLHWGSRTSPFSVDARLSVAFEFQRRDVAPFNQPLLDPRAIPPLAVRLRLIAKQILQYQHLYPLTPSLEQLARGLLDDATSAV